ncbi:hypothetical protein G6O69_09180 [Pseudenhygromyxa sp. WMMC2535]|uniref:hypothetical protein n=1 Tax=Pseudenhygromyxa sp. WMMC2535 TaxID=2712867 RepID=UPI0015549703|nr:hypothetical protein [Pseudenhygromyxa sp. WMMC2535]NVB38003.1 hypothetical protein [Pseudenhygromyxa sp. WMMC2535]
MMRSHSAALAIALTLPLAALACEPPKPAEATKGAPEAAEPAAPEQAPAPTTVPAPSSAPAVSQESPDGSSRPGEPPPWYDEARFPGSVVKRKDVDETKFRGGFTAAMILVLAAGTSPDQCMQNALSEIAKVAGKTVADMPSPDTSTDRQVAHGIEGGYEWTVVCGDAEGKPMMFLSYARG